jgi:hypothetical protein
MDAQPWARVRHVIPAPKERRRSSVVVAAAALVCVVPALIMVLSRPSLDAMSRAQLLGLAADNLAREGQAVHPGLAAAEAKGLIQPVSLHAKANAVSNVIRHALAASGKSSARVKAAAVKAMLKQGKKPSSSLKAAVQMARLMDSEPAELEAELMAPKLADMNPDKVLVKVINSFVSSEELIVKSPLSLSS